MSINPINLKANDRVLIVGKTGSGKTYLSKFLTRSIRRLIVFDAKATLTDWNLEPWNDSTRYRLFHGQDVRIRVLAPHEGDPFVFWNRVLTECYQVGNLTVYIDELYALTPPGKKPINVLWSLYTRGRELGIGVWSCSQRPAWIPMFALSEAEHFFCFRLQLEEDRKRMGSFMGSEVLQTINDPHGFFYSRADWDKPDYHVQFYGRDDIALTDIPAPVDVPKQETTRLNRVRSLFRKEVTQ